MADQTQAEKDAAYRVAEAERINAEVMTRLHQNDVQAGITEKPAPKAKTAKAKADE